MQGLFGRSRRIAFQPHRRRAVISSGIVDGEQDDGAAAAEPGLRHCAIAGGAAENGGGWKRLANEIVDQRIVMGAVVEGADKACAGALPVHIRRQP